MSGGAAAGLPAALAPGGPAAARFRSPAARVGRLLLALTSALVLLFSVGGWVVTTWFNGSIGRLNLSLAAPGPESGEQNWMLVGTDSRTGTGGAYGGTALVSGQRSDTAILAHLAADGTTTLVSIPRDTLVRIPAYTDARGVRHPAHEDKFNAALDLGGPALTVATVSTLLGLTVNHYAAVDLAGFTRLSDAVGGVTVCQKVYTGASERGLDDNGRPYVSTNLDDPYSGWHGRAGNQVIQGSQALAFVRQRHGLPQGDLGRIARQQQFLGAVFRKATSTGVLTSPASLLSVLAAAKNALTLDDGTSVADLETLATRFKGADASRLRFVTVPTTELRAGDPGVFADAAGVLEYRPPGATTSVGSVQLLDRPALAGLLATLSAQPARPAPALAGPTGPTGLTGLTGPILAPAAVTVAVVNATGRPGLAAAVSPQLRARGFRLLPASTAQLPATAVQVHYPPGQDAAARTVAGEVPGAVLIPDPATAGQVRLVLGTGYTRLSPPAAAGNAPTSRRPVVPSRAPTPVSAAAADNRCTY